MKKLEDYKLILWDWQDTLHNGNSTLPYVDEMLEFFYNKGIKQAIVSNASSRKIKQMIDNMVELVKWKEYLSLIVGNDMGLALKPSPDMILYASNFFNIDKTDILFFGDSQADKDAAAFAGCDFYFSGVGLKDIYLTIK